MRKVLTDPYGFLVAFSTLIGILALSLVISEHARAMEIAIPTERFETIQCELYYTEFAGEEEDVSQIVTDNVFVFNEEGLFNDTMSLVRINPKVISYKWVDNISEMYYSARWDRLVFLHSEKPLGKGEVLTTANMLVTLVDVVKLPEGYNYYVNKHNNCKVKL